MPDRYEAMIDGGFLLLPVGALAGTPLQAVTVRIDGRKVLEVDLPLAFGSIPVVGYLPVYDLVGYHMMTRLIHVSLAAVGALIAAPSIPWIRRWP